MIEREIHFFIVTVTVWRERCIYPTTVVREKGGLRSYPFPDTKG